MVFVDGSSVSRPLITWYQTLADCQRQRTEDAPRDEVVYRRWSCHYVSRTIIKGRGAYRTTTAVDWSFVDARLPQADLHRCIVRQRCRQCRAYTGWRHKNGWRGAHSGCFKAAGVAWRMLFRRRERALADRKPERHDRSHYACCTKSEGEDIGMQVIKRG